MARHVHVGGVAAPIPVRTGVDAVAHRVGVRTHEVGAPVCGRQVAAAVELVLPLFEGREGGREVPAFGFGG